MSLERFLTKLLFGSVGRFTFLQAGFRLFRLLRAGNHLEEVSNAKIVQKIRHTRVRVDQFQVRRGVWLRIHGQPGQNSQEGAVHGRAVRQIEQDMIQTAAPEFLNDILKVNAVREAGAAIDLDAGRVRVRRDHECWTRFGIHRPRKIDQERDRPRALLPTMSTKVCCKTRVSSRELKISFWLHCNRSSMARTSSASV
jgi:hypothetical protein